MLPRPPPRPLPIRPHALSLPHPSPATPPHRYEVRKKKKVATCIEEMAKEMAEKYVEQIGTNR